MPDRPAPSAGKTPKSQRTQAAILQAAQELFATQGYERTTVRDVAARAAIDPAMVMRYFGSKEGLFARATAFDLQLPDLTPGPAGPHRRDPGRALRGDLGGRAQQRQPDQPVAGGRLQRRRRKAIRTIFGGQVVPMLARVVPPAELFARAGLVATQIMGLAVTRYILKVPPVVAMDRAQLVKLLGPTMQRYVVGKL